MTSPLAYLRSPAVTELNLAERPGDRMGTQAIALAGFLGFIAAWMLVRLVSIHRPGELVCIFVFLTALPMIMGSLVANKTHLRHSSGLRSVPQAIDWRRGRIKFIGLALTLLLLAAVYRLIPEYGRSWYQPVWEVSAWLALPVLILSFPYIYWVDRRMQNPVDGYCQAGLLALGRWRDIHWNGLRFHAMGWLVKGFFLPFMVAGAADALKRLQANGINFSTFGGLFGSSLNLIYALDITFGAAGYLLTLRILDSHIQSVENTLLGWISTLCCYLPFSTLIWSHLLNYRGKTGWFEWLTPYPVILITWGFIILVLHGIYVWSTCSFGCRFSNLTNRGIIAEGPYRYFKHPAYLSKNLAWWMMAVPFVAHSNPWEAGRACLCLLVTNIIYGIRAWTEERHLRSDPAYQSYCEWMDQHGFLARCRSRLNCLISLWEKKASYDRASS